jgi:thiol-disulfide isomerase/thioredoxin
MRLLLLALIPSTLALAAADVPRDLREGEGAQRTAKDALEGKAAPAVAGNGWLNTTDGAAPDLKGKIVVLDFWATWCGPCIASIPKVNDLQAKYAAQGVVFIGVCHPEGAERMAAVAKEHGIAYPICVDAGGKTGQSYLVDGYPDYHVIGRDGTLVVADCRNSGIEQALTLLLAK